MQLPPPPPIQAETPETPPPTPPAIVAKKGKPLYTEVGWASWYGPPYNKRRAANGQIYDMNELTAAHRTLPLNSIVRVTNLKTGHSAILRITDRGPFVPDRIIDLSLGAAKALDVWRPGTAEVRIEVLETPAPITQGGRWAVQIGKFDTQKAANKLKERLERRYSTARVLEFSGPMHDWWVRVRVPNDDKVRAEEVAHDNSTPEGHFYLVRLD